MTSRSGIISAFYVRRALVAICDAWEPCHSPDNPNPEPPVDDRRACGRSWPIALRAGGPLHAISLRAADGVLDRMAAAAGRRSVDVDAEGGGGYRRRCRLRFRSGVQSSVQARIRRAAGALPAQQQGSGGLASITRVLSPPLDRDFALCSHLPNPTGTSAALPRP